MLRTTLVFICAGALGACSQLLGPSSGGDPNGVYSYLAQIGNAPVVEGQLTLVVADDSSVSGTWELRRVPASDTTITVGPQLGRGTLRGQLSGSELWLDLNPGWADNNVFLSFSTKTAAALAGMWDHSTLLGPIAGGPVRLRRVQR